MNKDVLDYAVGKTHELLEAGPCSSETKTAAKSWLEAVGTEDEAAETKRYVKELEEDIMTIDGLIGFAQSDKAAQLFGAENAKKLAAHAEDIKSAGAKYCDCPACAAAEAILLKKEQLLQ